MRQRKVLIAEVDLTVRAVYEQAVERRCSGPGCDAQREGDHLDHVVLEVGHLNGSRIEAKLREILGADGSLTVILTSSPSLARPQERRWSAEACILDGSRLARIKEAAQRTPAPAVDCTETLRV